MAFAVLRGSTGTYSLITIEGKCGKRHKVILSQGECGWVT